MRLLLCCLCVLLLVAACAVEPPSIQLSAGELLVEMRSADVTGDGALDHLIFVESKDEPDFPGYRQELRLLDGASGKMTVLPLTEQGGYGRRIMLPRIDDDDIPDIFVEVNDGGSAGSCTYFIFTATGGTPATLVPSERFDTLPETVETLLPNYRARIELTEYKRSTTIDLRQVLPDKQARDKAYLGVYSPDGRLLDPDSIRPGPYWLIEPENLDGDANEELVGYQRVSASAHANDIALIRTTWDWQGKALAVTGVTVIPSCLTERYTRELRALPKTAAGVAQAIRLFREHFPAAPAAWREQAFRDFRTFHQTMLERESERFTVRNDDDIAIKRYNNTPANREAGIIAYTTEYEPVIEVRPGFYFDTFATYLPPAAREYLRMEKEGYTWPLSAEGQLIISLEKLGEQVRAWEGYLERYPDSPFVAEALMEYRYQVMLLLFGDDGASHFDFDTERMLPEAKEALRQYVRKYPDSPAARQVTAVLALYARHNDIGSVALTSAIEQYVKRHDEERAWSYFPTGLTSTWEYCIAGPAPSRYRLTAAYAKDGQVQLNRKEDVEGYLIFDVRQEKVTQISSALKARTAENRLSNPNSMYQVQLLEPIRKGHAWVSNGIRHEILRTGLALPVFGQTYFDVIEVARTSPADRETGMRDYYAVGVGLIRRDILRDGAIIGQELLWNYQPEAE